MVAEIVMGPSVLWGPAIGGALFMFLARDRPRLPSPPLGVAFVRGGHLVVTSAYEEVVWRGLGLGIASIWLGAPVALLLATVAFALSHHGRRAPHVATGFGFGIAFLAGGLIAAVVAHASYNVLVDLAVHARRGAGP